MGYFEYELKDNVKSKGAFFIYQARNGGLYLAMGNSHTDLAYEQVTDLHIDIYSICKSVTCS